MPNLPQILYNKAFTFNPCAWFNHHQTPQKKVEQDGDWEELAMNASDNSINDELWTFFFILIIPAVIRPDSRPYIKEGFGVLKDECPDWLSWGILASIGASFELKSIGQFKGK